MNTLLCRYLPLQEADGPTLMSADEVLLDAAVNGQLALRFYTWDRPTLSLGYFQAAAMRLENPLLAEVDWVRRSSGGGAILHHHELTYALAIPAEIATKERESWLCRMHHLIIEVLAENGARSRGVACGEEKKLEPFLCFLHQTPGDLLIQENKIVGSAQRRIRGAILQHGSILLKQSLHTPRLPGIAELASVNLSVNELADQLKARIVRDWNWELDPSSWTPDELRQTLNYRAEKYADPRWNLKR
jgi:lipoyl(octanoyl) transferase